MKSLRRVLTLTGSARRSPFSCFSRIRFGYYSAAAILL